MYLAFILATIPTDRRITVNIKRFIYIYIYIYMIEQYRYFLSMYFCIYPFKLLYQCYNIHLELINKPPIIN